MFSKDSQYRNFSDFYPYYLSQHQKRGTRALHFVGTLGFLILSFLGLIQLNFWPVLGGIVFAYGLAWLSHFFIEKNKPATFHSPVYSLMGDFRMMYEILRS